MQVLVYGEWEGQTKNMKPFFTASYWDVEKKEASKKTFSTPYTFLFVGSLVEGKRPLYAIKLVEKLIENGILASLSIFGDGLLRQELEAYVETNNLKKHVNFKGNQTPDEVKEGYKEAHFLLLASKSEGWPKVVAEAMFWGTIPISTSVSCVSWMLDSGNRGLLLSLDLDKDLRNLRSLLLKQQHLEAMSQDSMSWSREYTLDRFETELKGLL
jgi:glycosyltransferase involved in cell wall biosynthesis